jgi:hypothetical protein
MKEIIEAFGESSSAGRRLHGISESHFFEGEDHAVTRALFDAHGAGGNFSKGSLAQELLELAA